MKTLFLTIALGLAIGVAIFASFVCLWYILALIYHVSIIQPYIEKLVSAYSAILYFLFPVSLLIGLFCAAFFSPDK
ncbi:hypothetical protein BH09VER1_BH09VER1_01350 [soil metagenome]